LDSWKSIAMTKQNGQFRDSTAMISWDATLSSTKHVPLEKAEGAEAVGGVVADLAEAVEVAVPEAEAVVAGVAEAVDATAATVGIAAAAAAGRPFRQHRNVRM
jgi:type IV secretory pathway TrbL component